MTCLPMSGGCERWATDPFIEHINSLEHSTYKFIDTPDLTDRNSPQPEALYADHRARTGLVVERKSILWPPSYAQHHNNDHELVARLEAYFGRTFNDRLYTLRLPKLGAVARSELDALALTIASAVFARAPLDANRIVGGKVAGQQWAFYVRRPDETDIGEPEAGIIYVWEEIGLFDDYLDPEALPAGFTVLLSKVYDSCRRKFSQYMIDRRILLIDPYGKVRYQGVEWWRVVLHRHPPPAEVPEIWLALLDFIDDYERDWVFERIL